MAEYGADCEQLTGLGRTMQQQKVTIDGVISAVNSTLSGTLWKGPAREQFESDWNTTFKSALGRLMEAFDMAGNDCIKMSTALGELMGSRR
jgi:uncharacterized protein YukE